MEQSNNNKSKESTSGSRITDAAKSSGASPPVGETCYNRDNTTSSLKIEENEFLNSDEAARFLGIDVGSLHNGCSAGKIPYYKFGRRNRYRKDELKALLLAEPRGDRK